MMWASKAKGGICPNLGTHRPKPRH